MASNAGLGTSLLRDKSNRQKQRKLQNKIPSRLHSQITGSAPSTLSSVTEVKQLDEFLSTAQLMTNEYKERESQTFSLAHAKLNEHKKSLDDNDYRSLPIPLKPDWSESMSAEEFHEKEYSAFMDWRRELARIEETDGISLTPFEKNFELWRQLWHVLDRSDILIQTVDARNPLLYYSVQLDEHVKKLEKDTMILVNKADLLTSEQRNAWGKYFIQHGMTYAFFSALTEMNKVASTNVDSKETSSAKDTTIGKTLNRSELLQFLRQFLFFNEKETLTVGLIGFPNVGKSSIINSLLASKRVCTSATPGKTKHFQTFELTSELNLCDCPGLVFPTVVSSKAELILAGTLPIDQLHDHSPAANLLVERIPKHVLQSIYGLRFSQDDAEFFSNGSQLLAAYAVSRGFTTQRGLPDEARAARLVLKDYVNGKLLYCHCPTGLDQKTYHVFPSKQDTLKNASEKLHDEFDTFFDQLSVEAHVKSNKKQDGGTTDSSNSKSKPWKKHYNNNKRTKLRKAFAHLDK